MNLFWILFAGFQFLELTEETVQLKALPQDSYESPIALIRNQGSTRLQLATPVEYETGKYWNRAIYAYNDSADEHGPAEEFRTACPLSIYTSQESEKRIEREWRAKNQPSEYGSLFFVDEVDWMYDLHCDGCSIKPSIQRITNEEGSVESCGLSAAEMWGVGFPIADKKQKVLDH
ncbi:uncharacterized protein LOC135848989 [Planococcus citri]|uniref:uncharacterized protein LOC135848989 n=1 Tax=Planococcus citri TaxID=170843 RepID=UPI0031F7320B